MPTTDLIADHVQVRGSTGNIYLVSSVGVSPVACSCPDFVNRSGPAGRHCKHMRARSGQSSVGVTRCGVCAAMLTPAELDAQPRDDGFSRHLRPRHCMSCGGF